MQGAGLGGNVVYHSRFLVPLPPGYEESGPSLEELQEQIGSRAKRLELAAFGVGLVLAAVWCGIVLLVKQTVRRQGLGATFTLVPGDTDWFLPLIFGGLVALGTGTWFFLRFTFGESHADYIRMMRLKLGYCADKLTVPVLAVGTVLALLLFGFEADNYTIIRADSITLNPYFSFGATTHSYKDVERIVTAPQLVAPNGKPVNRRVYMVYFRGGDKWNIENGPGISSSKDAEKIVEIANYIAKQSKVPITEQLVLQRSEL
jgi:hypothetical protein